MSRYVESSRSWCIDQLAEAMQQLTEYLSMIEAAWLAAVTGDLPTAERMRDAMNEQLPTRQYEGRVIHMSIDGQLQAITDWANAAQEEENERGERREDS